MATRDIVPRADGEGEIGTTEKAWLSGHFKTIYADNYEIEHTVRSSFTTTELGDAIVAASNSVLRWETGTYLLTTTIDKTLTGHTHWIAEGKVTIKYTGTSAAYAIQLALGGDFIMDGPFTIDGNSLAGTGIRLNNSEATMATAMFIRMTDVRAINCYSDTNARYAAGLYFKGAFNLIKLDRCGAKNISRAAALTGSPISVGFGCEANSITSYVRQIVVTDPYIDLVTAEDGVSDGTYTNMDGLNVGGPAASSNGDVKMQTSLIVRGGTFINCHGRSIKSQMEFNLIDGTTFIRDADAKGAMPNGMEVDFQYGSGVLTNYKINYGLSSTGGASFASGWTVCNSSVRGLATGEGAVVVSNGEIINNVPVATSRLNALLKIYIPNTPTGAPCNIVVENNTILGSGGLYYFIFSNEGGGIKSIKVNQNYVNDLSLPLVYCAEAYGSTLITANGNYQGTGSINVAGGASTIPPYYGTYNYGFTNVYGGERCAAQANVNDGDTITHYAATTPTAIICTPSVAGEMVSVTALGATTFTVAIKKHDNSAGTQQTLYWKAVK